MFFFVDTNKNIQQSKNTLSNRAHKHQSRTLCVRNHARVAYESSLPPLSTKGGNVSSASFYLSMFCQ